MKDPIEHSDAKFGYLLSKQNRYDDNCYEPFRGESIESKYEIKLLMEKLFGQSKAKTYEKQLGRTRKPTITNFGGVPV